MKKYLFLFLIPFAIVACKPTTQSSGDTGSPSVFGTPPGTIYWTGSGGRANKDFRGTFDKWKINSFNVPSGDYSKIKAEIAVDIASVNVNPDGLENHLRADDYLDATGHPIATINIDGAVQVRDNEHGWKTTNATLKLKGETQKVELFFSVLESKPAKITGTGTVFRMDHKVGDMESEMVKNGVPIEFEFTVPK